MGSERVAARFLVRGRVQGVGFRAATRREAQTLGVDGRAVNLPDGRVEVIAEGSAVAVQALADWLHRGPALARVDAVDREDIPASGRAGFGVG
ncbi:MAG TPA: acylphosphatase [Vicinamibacterales bacterium]|nr:acylphosphatase [Vicinamibacterales bacterium]